MYPYYTTKLIADARQRDAIRNGCRLRLAQTATHKPMNFFDHIKIVFVPVSIDVCCFEQTGC